MIKSLFLIAFVSGFLALKSVAQSSSNSNDEMDLAERFISSSSFRELLNYDEIKTFITSAYGNIRYGPEGITTFIHESSHVYDNIKSAGMGRALYYWSDSGHLLHVNINSNFFATDSILSLLPKSVVDKPLTQAYVLCNNNCMSRAYGIYGLLEEFNAYSLQPRSLVEMFEFFDTCVYTNTTSFWEGYLKCKYDSERNFYYFTVYFSAYLQFAVSKCKLFHDQLVNDAIFRDTFYQIYKKYTDALTNLDSLETKVRQKIDIGAAKKYAYPFSSTLSDS
jgi:hypothetical protein